MAKREVSLQKQYKDTGKSQKGEQEILARLQIEQIRLESAQERVQRAEARMQKRQARLERLESKLKRVQEQPPQAPLDMNEPITSDKSSSVADFPTDLPSSDNEAGTEEVPTLSGELVEEASSLPDGPEEEREPPVPISSASPSSATSATDVEEEKEPEKLSSALLNEVSSIPDGPEEAAWPVIEHEDTDEESEEALWAQLDAAIGSDIMAAAVIESLENTEFEPLDVQSSTSVSNPIRLEEPTLSSELIDEIEKAIEEFDTSVLAVDALDAVEQAELLDEVVHKLLAEGSVVEPQQESADVMLSDQEDLAEALEKDAVEASEQEQKEPVVQLASEAREVAQIAEEAALLAAQRASSINERLEQGISSRHLASEASSLQSEADSTRALSDQAAETALQLEQLSNGSTEQIEHTLEQIVSETRTQKEQIEALRLSPLYTDEEASPEEDEEQNGSVPPLYDDEDDITFAIPDVGANRFIKDEGLHPPTPLEIARVEEINDDEHAIETATAMIIADVTANAAAEAEALAEASSAYTREARRAAYEAELTLQKVRDALQQGKIASEEGEKILASVEGDVTHANAALADAEAAEEQAISAARNAEAEAEVAEGMAYASGARSEQAENEAETFSLEELPVRVATNGLEDDEDTEKRAAVRPPRQESM